MKIGIGLPFKMPTDSWDYISTVARKADEGPFSSFSALDRLAYDNFEAMIEIAAVASITTCVAGFPRESSTFITSPADTSAFVKL